MSSSPLDAFVQQLWHVAVPIGIVAVVIGTVAGLLFRGFASWFSRFLRNLLRPSSAPPSAPSSDGPLPDAPHCPKCNRIMVARLASKGAQAGKRFWGCSAFPDCRATREMIATSTT